MLGLVKFIHLSSLSVWIGTMVFFSFFAAPAIFRVLPGETAGEVVGEIFPWYWRTGYVSGLLALVTLIFISYAEGAFPVLRLMVLSVMTGTGFYCGLVVGGEARSIKESLKTAERDQEKESLREAFKKVHRRSSRLNMTVLALGAVVLYLTARGLSV